MISQEQIESCKIPTPEIEQDIAITEREIKDFQDELDVLERNPTENKLRIYMLGGNISKRRIFIKQLNAILEWRKDGKLQDDYEASL